MQRMATPTHCLQKLGHLQDRLCTCAPRIMWVTNHVPRSWFPLGQSCISPRHRDSAHESHHSHRIGLKHCLSTVHYQQSTQRTQLHENNLKLSQAMTDIATLQRELDTLRQSTGSPLIPPNSSSRRPFVRKWFNTNYCWSHGFHVADNHTSANCNKPREGHKKTATPADTMGGKFWQKSECA
jgi:hypothetical protein